jgi:hypothetical protein
MTETYVNARKQSNLKYPTGAYLELDVWIPEHNIGFEFQVHASLSIGLFVISYK